MLKKSNFVILIVLLIGIFTSSVFAASNTLTVLGVWTGAEAEAFNKMIAPFESETGIKVEFTGTRDLPAILTTQVEAGNPPDVSALPNPGQMIEFAKAGKSVVYLSLLT
jgi:alpha-glucoside transport system substrate-binding protein